MSTADHWHFTVHETDGELLAELRRHGVRPGVHVYLVTTTHATGDEAIGNPEFFGSFTGAPDLAERAGEIVRAEFPHRR